MSTDTRFAYAEAFDRNVGWLTEAEQAALRGKRVAIAGCGGVGGAHLLALARLGIGAFNLADMDVFELANFNRQVGATMATLGRPKVEVMAEMAREINPELDLRIFEEGVQDETVAAFLDDADLFVDGFDFHAIAIRRRVFAAARARGIPAMTAGPIGLGAAFVIFRPDAMSFDEYFRMGDDDQATMEAKFLDGLVPEAWHRDYLMVPERFDLARKRAPSIGATCLMCAGIVGITAIKLLTGRGEVLAAPWHHNFDPFRNAYLVEPRPGAAAAAR